MKVKVFINGKEKTIDTRVDIDKVVLTNEQVILYYFGNKYTGKAQGEKFDLEKGIYCCFTKILFDGYNRRYADKSDFYKFVEDLKELYNCKKDVKKELLENEFLVNTKTQEQFDELMQWLENNTDKKWTYDQKPTELKILPNTKYKENTVIRISQNFMSYCDVEYFEKWDCNILNYEEIWE